MEAAGADVGYTEQNVSGQLTLDREIPLISSGNMIVAAGVVGHSNLIEGRIVREVRRRRERAREGWIGTGLRARAVQSRLGRSLGAEGIAE